jgi:hypothetical protein
MLAVAVSHALDSLIPPQSPLGTAYRSRPIEYAVQAVGFVRDNRHLVYVNGFDLSTVAHAPDSTYWRRQPVMVCDGAQGFFGAEYDPGTQALSALVFNGSG